jgi:hypothetical protein
MELIVWMAVGIWVVAGQGPVVLNPSTFATKAECQALLAKAAEMAAGDANVVGIGQDCVPLTVRRAETATKPSAPKIKPAKPAAEIIT